MVSTQGALEWVETELALLTDALNLLERKLMLQLVKGDANGCRVQIGHPHSDFAQC